MSDTDAVLDPDHATEDRPNPVTVGDVVDRHRLVVTVGTGGVGKTTLAAAIALGGALRGRRAMVLTIDPAHQLARALGLDALHPEGERVGDTVFEAAGLRPEGTLTAAMLDQKGAWDAFVDRHAPSLHVRESILHNPFYEQLSTSFAGALEYVAIEELCRLHESGAYDLIVLDTPPTGGALDFLDAPDRLDRFLLDRELVGWLAKPVAEIGRGVRRAAGATVGVLLRRLERATGAGTLRDVSAFFRAIQALLGDIEARTRAARGLLRAHDTAFTLVAGPNEQVLAESSALWSRIRNLDVPLRAAVLNRVHPLPGAAGAGTVQAVLGALAEAGADPASVGWIRRTHEVAATEADAERARWERFVERLPTDVARTALPERDQDLHSMADLADTAERLWRGEDPFR